MTAFTIDHQKIEETRDRSKSFELLELLSVETKPERLHQLVSTLSALDDPRLIPRLEALLLNPAIAGTVRTACGEILQAIQSAGDCSDETLRRWWDSADNVLRRHALLQMCQGQRDIVDAVLDDSEHPFYVDAIDTLAFGFSSASTTRRLTVALQDARPEVRSAAASTLLWDEPVGACPALLAVCRDADASVAESALETLVYYPTLATMETAHSLREHENADIRAAAASCFGALRSTVLLALSEPATEEHLRGWLRPVWELLSIEESDIEELRKPIEHGLVVGRSTKTYPWMRSPEAFDVRFGNLDTEWVEIEFELRNADWAAIPESRRGPFIERLLASPDITVRECAARALVAWNARDQILKLLADSCFMVRKAAMYHMRELGPDPVLAAYAWQRLPNAHSTHLYETLETAIALSAPGSWFERVEAIVADENMEECARFHGIHALGKAGAREAIAANLPLLQRSPVITWGIHEALAEWAMTLQLILPDLSHLQDVDHLSVQVMLASIDANR